MSDCAEFIYDHNFHTCEYGGCCHISTHIHDYSTPCLTPVCMLSVSSTSLCYSQAYYQMHGIDHVLLFDHGTTDNSYRELEPWLQSGFVTILSNITEMISDMPYHLKSGMKPFDYMMEVKSHIEMVCAYVVSFCGMLLVL